MKPLIQRLAEHLADHGPTATTVLADRFGLPPEQISEAVRHARSRGRYGLYVVRRVPRDCGRGAPINVWNVDCAVLQSYLELRGEYAATKKITRAAAKPAKPPKPPKAVKPPKPPKVIKEPKVDYTPRKWVFNGPHRTVWQPSSPYFKGATA